MMFVAVGGVDWFYTMEGQGEPVLFLHGGFDSCVNYSRLLMELAETFQVIAMDRRGHGKTRDTDAPFDYAVIAEEVREFMDALGLESSHVIGYSDGANIGLHMASRFPEKLKSLIAISGNYKGLSGMSEGWLETMAALSVDFVREYMPETLDRYVELNPRPMPEQYIEKTKALWNRETIISSGALSTLQVRTLIIGGDRDIVLPEQQVEMHRLVPGSSLLLLPYGGHFIFQDFSWSSTASCAVEICKNFLSTNFADHNRDFI